MLEAGFAGFFIAFRSSKSASKACKYYVNWHT